jgi:L-iduronidase
MDITVNVAESLGPLRHFWQSTGFTPANLLLNADMQQAMAYVGGVPHGGITWVRIHYLLELVMAEDLETETPTYDWSRLDTALDALVRHGLKPFFELMGNVGGYFTDYTDEAQAAAWRRLVCDLALHLIARYGQREVRSWLFETWNEPDVGFWQQSDEAFCTYYDACAAGLHDADPVLRLGGPGTCRDLSSTLKAFLAHCDTGTHALTGEEAAVPAFLSVHVKGVRSHPEDLTPNTMSIVEREAGIVDYIREHHPRLASLPFINNECDPQVGWGTIHTWRARPYYAALAVKVINQHLVKLVDEKGVDYSLLSNDNGFLGAWGHRTLLARFGETDHIDHGQAEGKRDAPRFEEDPGRRRFELVKKPIFDVMTLLALLGDERCAVEGAGDVAQPLGVIATRRGASQVAVLIYNSEDKIMRSGSTSVTLRLEGVPFESAALAYYRIDENHGDPFTVWEAMGAPDSPTEAQYAEIRAHQELTPMAPAHAVTVENGTLVTSFAQPLPGVTLVLLSARPEDAPKPVKHLRFEHYEGMTGKNEVLVMWEGLDSRVLRTYEVLFATDKDGPYRRINTTDQVDTAFLHVRDVERGFYSVRAVDYWNRYGDAADPVEA